MRGFPTQLLFPLQTRHAYVLLSSLPSPNILNKSPSSAFRPALSNLWLLLASCIKSIDIGIKCYFSSVEGSFGRDWPPSSVTCSQSPFVTAAPALDEPSVWKSHTQPSK